MCIAVLKPEGISLYEHTLQNCWDANSDGAGFMFAESGKLHIQKGFFTFDEFMEAYEPHKEKKCVLHFRIRTHGNINTENCHPYQVDDNLAFVHNGTIHDVQGADLSFSDTWYFNRDFLQPIRKLDKGFFKKEHYQKLIEKYIGWSKLIFLNSKGEHQIINEGAGNWDSQCWFSNTSWKRSVTSYVPPKAISYTKPVDSVVGSIITNDTPLGSGDVCWVNKEAAGFKYGEYVVVKYVYADNTIGVYDKLNPQRDGRIHASCLIKSSIKGHRVTNVEDQPKIKEGDLALFKQNFNHFRVNDDVLVEQIYPNNTCLVFDGANEKNYTVPMYALKAFDLDSIWVQ